MRANPRKNIDNWYVYINLGGGGSAYVNTPVCLTCLSISIDPERGVIWEREIKRYLPGYVQVQSHQLVGLLLCIFVKEELVDCIRDVQYEITKVFAIICAPVTLPLMMYT